MYFYIIDVKEKEAWWIFSSPVSHPPVTGSAY